ncbi:class I adenylate-forming enzyme family protein [Nonomuraea jabiensis]|uniref:Cyclohexanecarboxylate-CoA ligase n=1 Tax=Nonomuraea jabiensis TaxID=882448 RepID=A0A7W9L9A5_9ACTN|nr:AMP-binding protein [Nonomuraea jabiensis]MBB5775394.1 cyclohexanecarboxylate-CoA ligase [Nonomuraea jabiensis]
MSLTAEPLPELPTSRLSHYEQGWWRRETFLDDLRALARDAPDSPAYLEGDAVGGETQVISFGRLAEETERLAAALWERGTRPGDVVAYQLPDSWQNVALWLACGRIGAVVASLGMTAGVRERDLILDGIGAALFVAAGDRAEGRIGTVPVAAMAGLLSQAETASSSSLDHVPGLGPDDICQMLFTSGTTGRIKAVMHTPNSLYAAARSMTALLPADGPTSCLIPLTSAFSLTFNVAAPLVTGRPTVLLPLPDPGRCLDLIARNRVTCVASNPARLNTLLQAQRRRPRDLSGLRQIVSGGAALSGPIADGIRTVLCPAVANLYGMTESGVIAWTSPSDPAVRAENSAGHPVPGIRLQLRERHASGAGCLHVQGPAMCRSMIDVRTGETLWDGTADEGWYDTGDVVQQDEQGRLRFLSRVADRIGWGFMIPIAEVEDELLGHPAVAEVTLVGIVDAEGLESACAVIVPDGNPPSLDEVNAFLRARNMTEGYLPARLAIASALPRTATGKVRKAELREQILSGGLAVEGPMRTT